MDQAVTVRPVAMELYGLLRDLDPSRWDGLESPARKRIAELAEQVNELAAAPMWAAGRSRPWATAAQPGAVAERLDEIATHLRERVPAENLPSAEKSGAWAGYRKQLAAAYEALSLTLKNHQVHVPSLRPTNHTRSLFHVLTSLSVILLAEELFAPWQIWFIPLCFASVFWTLELARKLDERAQTFLLSVFRHIAHPHERFNVNSATWFVTALLVMGLLYAPLYSVIGLAVLGTADPAAGLIGRRWGRTPLFNGRTLEGTLTFALVGAVATFSVLSLWHSELGMGTIAILSASAALVAAPVELLSRRVDDNFSIPIAAATGAYLASLFVL